MSRRLAVAISAALATLALAACGGKVIDDEKAEDFVQNGIESNSKFKVSSVDCPSGVDVEKGKTFDCTADTDRGKYTITIRMTDDDGTIVPLDAKAAK